jgi:RND family efflux transporter MFP subunit
MILKVDPRDYSIAVSMEEANLLKAQLDLELEQQRGHTAAAEWEQLGAGGPAGESQLTLRKPQLAAATARLAAAEQGLARAELNLERTVLRAPFASMVLNETAEKGQLLVPGSPVLSLIGTARFVVRVSVPLADLQHIVLGTDKKPGSPVRVTQRLTSGDVERTGWVKQLAGQIDPQSGTATVFVAIDDPLEGDGLPLLPGAFVEVVITGRAVPGAVKVPRSHVQEGGILWTVEDGKLQSRKVQVGWADGEHAFITEGLSAGAAIVVTPLSLPVNGAPVSAQDVAHTEG